MASKAWTLAAVLLLACPAAALSPAKEKRELIHAALVIGGIGDCIVDVSDQRVLVVYEQAPASSDQMVAEWAFIAGVASAASPQSKEVVIVAANHGEQVQRITVKVQDCVDFSAKRMDAQTFNSGMKAELQLSPKRDCQANAVKMGGECVCERGYEQSGGVCAPRAQSSSAGAWCVLGGFGLAAAAGAFAFLLAAAGLVFWKMRGRKSK
jgi:hypothetical protein